MKEFIIKCLVVTACVAVLSSCFVPKYYFIDNEHVGNIFTGKIEHFSNYFHTWSKK